MVRYHDLLFPWPKAKTKLMVHGNVPPVVTPSNFAMYEKEVKISGGVLADETGLGYRKRERKIIESKLTINLSISGKQ